MVTLGALNGVPGSSIAIYDGDKKIGSVTVTMPLDVISYAGAAIGSKICP